VTPAPVAPPGSRPAGAPRLLLVSMYPLDRGLWGATTRITQLRDELSRLARLDVVSGRRMRRAQQMAAYVGARRLRGLDGIYVENSTALPGPADLAFLGLARSLGIPVLTYLRDAQQLYPEYYSADTLKRRVSRAAFLPAMRALIAVSTQVAFPSRGLALAILRDDAEADSAILLPPGARLGEPVPIDPSARDLIFVGALRREAHGRDILYRGMEAARAGGADIGLICVSRPGEEPPPPLPEWMRLVRAEGPGIDRLLGGVRASITPRRKTPYNDLGVPIKVMEYLGYGRPLIVTDVEETTRIVREAEAGVVVPDTAEGLAHGISAVASAPPEQIEAWGIAARRAAERYSWHTVARRILDILGLSTPVGASA
jgi:glycosyltransferase involved in cell wall biosynthesis